MTNFSAMTPAEIDRLMAEEVKGWHIFDGRWHEWNGETRVNLGYWAYQDGYTPTDPKCLHLAAEAFMGLSEEQRRTVSVDLAFGNDNCLGFNVILNPETGARNLCEAILSAMEV